MAQVVLVVPGDPTGSDVGAPGVGPPPRSLVKLEEVIRHLERHRLGDRGAGGVIPPKLNACGNTL